MHSLDLGDEPECDLVIPGERDPDAVPRIEEPRGGWFREQRRRGIGIVSGKPRPRYNFTKDAL